MEEMLEEYKEKLKQASEIEEQLEKEKKLWEKKNEELRKLMIEKGIPVSTKKNAWSNEFQDSDL